MLSWDSLKSMNTADGFDLYQLDQITKGNALMFVGWAVLGSPYAQASMGQQCGAATSASTAAILSGGYTFMDDFKIPPIKLVSYLRGVQHGYHTENPYRSALQAAEVLQSLHAFLQMGLEANGHQVPPECPSIRLFSILLAAVVHDVYQVYLAMGKVMKEEPSFKIAQEAEQETTAASSNEFSYWSYLGYK